VRDAKRRGSAKLNNHQRRGKVSRPVSYRRQTPTGGAA
jgi:hypothetical protein